MEIQFDTDKGNKEKNDIYFHTKEIQDKENKCSILIMQVCEGYNVV
jgi:hypothetical protein